MRRPAIPVLTTLRFPAAVAIVLFHFLALTRCPHWIWDGFGAGVSFFYVLSGFILYYNHVHLMDVRSFGVARFARIWPVHLVTLILVFILLPFNDLEGHASWPVTLPANLFLLHAWLPFQGSALSYNGVSWSLSVEAFFYVCFPWLLGRLQRDGPGLVLVVSFILGLALVGIATLAWPSHAAFVGAFNPACRVFEFILGMAVCRHWLSQRRSNPNLVTWTVLELGTIVVSLALVVALPALANVLQVNNAVTAWISIDLCAFTFAALIWVYAHQAGIFSRLLARRGLTWFGEISFAVYMCHQIVLRCMKPELIQDASALTRLFGWYCLIVLLLSAAIFHFIETPARLFIMGRYKRQNASRR